MLLTEAEQLILSGFSYSNKFPKEKFDKNGYPIERADFSTDLICKELRKKATDGCNELKALLNEDGTWKKSSDSYNGEFENYKASIDSLCEKIKKYNCKVTKCINKNTKDDTGFMAIALEPQPNLNNEVFISCRGSDAKNALNNDWVNADLALLANEMTDQQNDMAIFMQGMEKYDGIWLTGHSLGGNLSMFGAIVMNCPELIKGVYSFDGPGFNTTFVSTYSKIIQQLTPVIHNMQNEKDVVSSLLISIGTIRIVNQNGYPKEIKQLAGHDRFLFDIKENGEFNYNLLNKKDIDYQKIKVTSVLLSAAFNLPDLVNPRAKPQALFSYEKHNFSDAAKNEMINIMDNVEKATFSELNGWKQFYGCGWVLGSSAKLAREKITEWYLSLSQANIKSKSKIKNLFRRIVEIDKAQGVKMQNTGRELDKLIDSLKNEFIYRIQVK